MPYASRMNRPITPVIGPRVPRRGHAFSRWIGRSFLRLLGWRVEGTVPDLPRMVMIGAPHTSNMDGVISIAALVAMGLKASTMIKDSAFKGAMGPVLRFFGAIAIDRQSPKGVVEQSVDAIVNSPGMLLLIAPEGTRSGPVEWKRGFWHIARGAGVPVLPAAIHYTIKVVTFGPPLYPGASFEADFAELLAFYAPLIEGRHPERTSKPLCEAIGRAWQPPPAADAGRSPPGS